MMRYILVTYVSSSPERTRILGKQLARRVLRSGAGRRARVIALTGDLGAGKTTFAQGFFAGLGVRKRIISPTFILMRQFRLRGGPFRSAYHIDAYRLRSARESSTLGVRDIAKDPRSIVLVEWPERTGASLTRGAIRVTLQHGRTENERRIKIKK